ncbi:MAG TPA: hypothetical protein VKQ32_07570 [Polyangia bacterium]|nr:hypothetical protein [Polyangia bacterium]
MRERGTGLGWIASALVVCMTAPSAAVAEPDPTPAAAPAAPARLLRKDGSPTPSNYVRGPDETEPPQERRKRRFLALPFLGLHSYQNGGASAYHPGLRIGALLGGRVGDFVSLNGELSIDVSNVPDAPDYQERDFDFAFSPLFELAAGPLEVALGPKVGLFGIETQLPAPALMTSENVIGYLAGINAGLFWPITPRNALGLLASFDLKWIADPKCLTLAGQTQCTTVAGSARPKVFSLTAAALF